MQISCYTYNIPNKYLTPETAPGPDFLTRREYKVLLHIVMGMRNNDIAKELQVSVRTIETFRAHLHIKLKLRTIPELVFYAIKHGMIDATGKPTTRIWASY